MNFFPTPRIDFVVSINPRDVKDGTSNTPVVVSINPRDVKDGTSNTLTLGR